MFDDAEEVKLLLNSLAETNNVPQDIFENIKLTSDMHYFLPIYIIPGTISGTIGYDKRSGNVVKSYGNNYHQDVTLKIPAYYEGAFPDEVLTGIEFFEGELTTEEIRKDLIDKKDTGWTFKMAEHAKLDSVMNSANEEATNIMESIIMDAAKKEFKSVENLHVEDVGFDLASEDVLNNIKADTYEDVAMITYEYNGETYKAVVRKGIGVEHISLPQDSDSQAEDKKLKVRKNAGCGAAIFFLLLQFVLIHNWTITIVLVLIALGVWFKFNRDLNKKQGNATGSLKEKLSSIDPEQLLAPLKAV